MVCESQIELKPALKLVQCSLLSCNSFSESFLILSSSSLFYFQAPRVPEEHVHVNHLVGGPRTRETLHIQSERKRKGKILQWLHGHSPVECLVNGHVLCETQQIQKKCKRRSTSGHRGIVESSVLFMALESTFFETPDP